MRDIYTIRIKMWLRSRQSLTISVGLDLGEKFMSGEKISILHSQQEVLLFPHGCSPTPDEL